MPDEDPRSKFRATILAELREKGATSEVLEAVEKALNNDALLDRLFVRSSASFTIASPAVAVKAYEAYFGAAATAFASRPEGGGVQVQGNVLGGVIVGHDVHGKDVSITGSVSFAVQSMGETILHDLRSKRVDVADGERLLADYKRAMDTEKEQGLQRFAGWVKRHAGELSANGLAALSVILGVLKQ